MTDQNELGRQVAANFRWNFAANVMDLAFYTLAMSFVSLTTVMPLLVSKLTSSKLAIGLIPAIYSLGFLLPQLLMANHAERLRYKKPFVVMVSLPGERLPYLFIGLALWFLAGSYPSLTLLIFFVLLAVTATSSGIAMPAWSDLIAKVIPVQRRGLWAGTANGLGALVGIVGAGFAGKILASAPFAHNFALCFLMAAVAQIFSWVGLSLNREPAGLVVKPRVSLAHYLRQLPRVLHADRNYERFLIGRSVANLGGMAGGFLMVYGAERFGFGGTEVGLLTATLAGSQAVMNPVWGILGDRAGNKIVLTWAAFCMLLATAGGALRTRARGVLRRLRHTGRVAGRRHGRWPEYRDGVWRGRGSPDVHRADQYAARPRADVSAHPRRGTGHGSRLHRHVHPGHCVGRGREPDAGEMGERTPACVHCANGGGHMR